MKKKYGFSLFTPDEFVAWLPQQQVARTVLYVQEHHTYIPNYTHFKGKNHLEMQRGMRNVHMSMNGWSDIAQHFTIFPDGMIATGRSLEKSASCITGFNTNAICIENIGNFDHGGDAMRKEHREAILRVTAALCARFTIPVGTERLVYHHWFDLRTGARTNGGGVTKSCPGTAFFGGNKPADSQKNFIPAVAALLQSPGAPPKTNVLWYATVTADSLNIRDAPNSRGNKINQTSFGSILRVYEEKQGWLRIAASRQEWVSGKLVQRLRHGLVADDSANVRSGPGTGFEILEVLTKGEPVFVFAVRGKWLKISHDERWVASSLVMLDGGGGVA